MTVSTDLLYAGAVKTVKIGGVDIGGTYDGVAANTEGEFFDLNVDQVSAIVKKSLITRKATITLNVAEISLANLRSALGQASANLSGSTLYLTDDEQGETTLELVCPTPSGVGSRYYYFPRIYALGSGEHSYKKDAQTFVAVILEALPDTDNSDRIAYIMDKV